MTHDILLIGSVLLHALEHMVENRTVVQYGLSARDAVELNQRRDFTLTSQTELALSQSTSSRIVADDHRASSGFAVSFLDY